MLPECMFCMILSKFVFHLYSLFYADGVQGIKGFEVRIEGYRRDFRCDILSLEQNITRDTIDVS